VSDQSSSPRGIPPTLWAVLLVSLVGAFAVNRHPFQDARPPDQSLPAYRHTQPDDQDVESRQWQDPFTAIAAARHAVTNVLASPSAAPPDEPAHDLGRLQTKVHEHYREPLLVLGTLLPGAPYADDIEIRRRTRYAVLAGLSSAGYVSDDNQHIGYTSLAPPGTDTSAAHEVAAYEWFHPETPSDATARSRVLVLWLDQDNFRGTPLHRFSEIMNFIAPVEPESGTVHEVILGPADSDGLKDMSSELDQGCNFQSASRRNISVYSPRATALNWWIVSDLVKRRYQDTQTEPHADHFNDRCEHVHLYRTVASDFTVVKSLYKELQYRGIQSVSEIALITERDTLYARLISRYFNGCDGTAPTNDQFKLTREGEQSQPLCFTYLRGLDGLTPAAPDSSGASHASDTKAATAANAATAAPVAPETASGPSQLDYLRRMTLQLASQRDDPGCRWISRQLYLVDDSSVGHRCLRRIKAIGIVGSDVYDKLMILQALRSAFPRYIFFTTDLDARLTDQQNLMWTRELVVGSSLGLSLRQELQGSIPPFRDTYQAATYYSAFHAIEQFFGKHADSGGVIEMRYTRHPRVFEIGRTQAFDLTVDESSGKPCESRINCRSIAAAASPPLWSTGSGGTSLIVALVAMLIVIVMAGTAMGDVWLFQLVAPLFSRGSSSRDRRRIGVGAASLIAITLMSMWLWASLVHALTWKGERVPPPIFGGSSHWAASLVEALSILVVITLVIRGQRKLAANAKAMLKEFRFPIPAEDLMDSYSKWLQLPETPRRRRWKERVWFPLRRLSGNTNDPLPSNDLSALENLIAQYLYRGRWHARLMRVGFVTLLASLLVLVLEYILLLFEFNLGISFARGFALVDTHYVERGIEDFISLLNLLAVQFLIFWVADAMLLTRSFVLALKEDRPAWPEKVITERVKELGLAKEWTTLWLDLRLIGWRTGWVASLIWYPSLVIAAMAAAALTVEFGEFGFASNPIALVISAGFVVGAAVLLRRVAESWRTDVLIKLEDARIAGLEPTGEGKAGVAQLDRLSERVAALRDGAFAPYSQQPMVRAVLVPALTYGATAGLQFLHIN
jgi:hypothetical protein